MTDLDDAITKYRSNMTEIKFRTKVINRSLSSLENSSSLTGFRETDIELIYLQFRHCLELMMFASLAAHEAHGYELSKRISQKEYSASKLLKFVKRRNPKCYPAPVEASDVPSDRGMPEIVPIRDGFLTEDEFIQLYDKTCGGMLHARRISKFQDNHDMLVSEASYFRNRLVKLLNCHWIHINETTAFRVIMTDSRNGNVGLNVMEVVE